MKKFKLTTKQFEIIIAVALGITALLTAWASWLASLHGGNQATNYTKSTNLTAEGNSSWNEASQNLSIDMQVWTEISSLSIDLSYAEDNGNTEEAEKIEWKIDEIMNNRVSDEFNEAITWALEQEEYVTPFDKEGYTDNYYKDAKAALSEAQTILEQGQKDNSNGDKLGLASVFYSVVLFLLGIVSTFKNDRTKYIIFGVSILCFVLSTLIMLTVPLPTGFSLLSFFK